jgi:hypothetical protein
MTAVEPERYRLLDDLAESADAPTADAATAHPGFAPRAEADGPVDRAAPISTRGLTRDYGKVRAADHVDRSERGRQDDDDQDADHAPGADLG